MDADDRGELGEAHTEHKHGQSVYLDLSSRSKRTEGAYIASVGLGQQGSEDSQRPHNEQVQIHDLQAQRVVLEVTRWGTCRNKNSDIHMHTYRESVGVHLS